MHKNIFVSMVLLSCSALALGCIEDNPEFKGGSSSQASDTSGGTDGTSAESGGVEGTGTSGTSGGETTGDEGGGMTGNPGTSGNPGTTDTADTTGEGDASTTGGGAETSTTGVMCDPGLTDCGGNCVDLQTTKAHCGECDNKCMGNMVCEMGMCVPN